MTAASIDQMSPENREFLERLRITNPKLAAAIWPRPPQPPSMELCIHEAGHAVLDHVFGRRIGHALVRECSGYVMPCQADNGRVNYLHQIAILLAGDMAAADVDPWQEVDWREAIAAHVRGEKLGVSSNSAVEAQSDQRNAVIFAHAAAGGSSSVDAIYAHIREGWNIAVELITTPAVWAAILCVAEQLRAEHRLAGDAIHRVIDSHVPFGAFADRWPCPFRQTAPTN